MAKLGELQDKTHFATLALSMGPVWEDVQNARVPAQASSLDDPEARATAGGRITDEPLLFGPKDGRREKLLKFLEKPVQRRKHYVTDAHFLVALSPTEGWREDPEILAKALRHPARPLWLGRKACPPAAPVCPLMPLVSADSGLDALRRSLGESIEQESLQNRRDKRLSLLWEGKPAPESADAEALGIESGFPTRILDRRDWRRGIHAGESILFRGTMTLASGAD